MLAAEAAHEASARAYKTSVARKAAKTSNATATAAKTPVTLDVAATMAYAHGKDLSLRQ
jgi:hypothetical protein